MKKVVEVQMFDKNNNKLMTKVFDTKTVKRLAQIKRLSELEYDCDAHVRLEDAIVDVVNDFAINLNNDFEYFIFNEIDYFIIYNDYCESANVFKIGDIWPMETVGQCPRYAK